MKRPSISNNLVYSNSIRVGLLGLVLILGCSSIPVPNYIRFNNFKEYSEYKLKTGEVKELIKDNKIVYAESKL